MITRSLIKQVRKFASKIFPEVFDSSLKNFFFGIADKLNSNKWGILVLPITLLAFLVAQWIRIEQLKIITISFDTAKIIIDQRITNLATIFSITLVVIGWLITNISIKESISYQILFKKTYLYPIFYFIISLIACLMLFSLLRNQNLDLGNIVAAGTYLIFVALVLIAFLFVRLIKVVDPNFFYTALEQQVLNEIYPTAKKEIIARRSKKVYMSFCEQIGLNDGIRFMTDLSNHTGINITPLKDEVQETPDNVGFDLFASKKTYVVKDINLRRLSKVFQSYEVTNLFYYRPLSLPTVVSENFHPFYFPNTDPINNKTIERTKKAFKRRVIKKSIDGAKRSYQEYLHERFLKDIKEGRKENVQRALKIYSKIYELENKIHSNC